MDDQMAMFFILIIIVLVLVYKFFHSNNYTAEIPLGPGTYRIGEDLLPGKGDLVAVAGGGEFCLKERGNDVWSNSHKLGVTSPAQPSRFRNLTLKKGDILEIDGDVKMMLTPPAAIKDPSKENLTLGIYRFGLDVPPAKYDLKAVGGDGPFYFFEPGKKEYTICQDMAEKVPNKATVYHNLLCERDSEIWVEETLQLKLTKSKVQRGFLHILENKNP